MTDAAPRATTTDSGIAVESDEHSLTIGTDGPILLHDHYLIEQMAQFNRERVPERQPHAKGGGAFGRFEVTGDVSAYTKATVFQQNTTTQLGWSAISSATSATVSPCRSCNAPSNTDAMSTRTWAAASSKIFAPSMPDRPTPFAPGDRHE